jgi:hypothetical protein
MPGLSSAHFEVRQSGRLLEMSVQLARSAPMSLCAACGVGLSGTDVERGVCGHHQTAFGDEWAAGNRTFCDFVHRGIEPPNVPLPEVFAYEEGMA